MNMPIITSLLKSLGSIGLSLLTSLLTGPVIKRMIVAYFEKEIEKADEAAKKTEDKADDATVKMWKEILQNVKSAWDL